MLALQLGEAIICVIVVDRDLIRAAINQGSNLFRITGVPVSIKGSAFLLSGIVLRGLLGYLEPQLLKVYSARNEIANCCLVTYD